MDVEQAIEEIRDCEDMANITLKILMRVVKEHGDKSIWLKEVAVKIHQCSMYLALVEDDLAKHI